MSFECDYCGKKLMAWGTHLLVCREKKLIDQQRSYNRTKEEVKRQMEVSYLKRENQIREESRLQAFEQFKELGPRTVNNYTFNTIINNNTQLLIEQEKETISSFLEQCHRIIKMAKSVNKTPQECFQILYQSAIESKDPDYIRYIRAIKSGKYDFYLEDDEKEECDSGFVDEEKMNQFGNQTIIKLQSQIQSALYTCFGEQSITRIFHSQSS